MITESQIWESIQAKLEADDVFLVDLTVSPGNRIAVTIDKMTGVSIDYCVQISRLIEQDFDREVEDFELEVASAGIGQPFKVAKQYHKNIGKQVEVLTKTGQKLKGELTQVSESGFMVKVDTMIKPEGKKKKEMHVIEHSFKFEEIKSVKDIITF
ncbi:MAG: ribosome assembly cofactor RimP [Breznakibacter sp.]